MLDARILDKNAEYLGLNLEKFMDNAGIAVANTVLSMNADKILVVCGSGNNGGDGYVSAIHLKKIGKKVDILKVKEPKSPLCIKKYNDAISNNINFVEDPDFSQYDVIVDAMLGIGISKTPEEPYKTIIEKMNRYGKKIVSVDVPTGIGTSLQVNPHITVTMQFMKEEMNKENSGEIIVADVGFPKEVIEMI
ncbi:MAG: NAD(P)H-hydrate epimerase, partial [Thermoplasmata archaeon]